MDFGVMGLDHLVCSNSANSNNSSFAFENAAETKKRKWYGSGFVKQDRTVNEDDFRELKLAKTSCGEEMLKIPLQISNGSNIIDGQQMLSFSSPNLQTLPLPYFQHTSSAFSRNTGYGSTGMNSANVHGVLSGLRGPFTASQWMELEHQALIYKYITANVPIPSHLLNPIRKALESAGFSAFSGLRPNALGWGAFHMGFSNSDPEPGRCRRTDGKKWRCSRDAVADQKYCERHMNRGRHRSRKPVEGQTGHSASGITTTSGKLTPMASSTSTSASVVPAGGVSNSLGLSHHHQLKTLQAGIPSINRSPADKENADGAYQHTTNLSMASPKISLKETQYSIPKQQNAYEETSRQEFGFVCSDSLLNPLDRSASIVNCRNYSTSDNLNDHENKSQQSLRQFMDEWPKNHQSEQRSTISWHNIDLQPDRTQLSISIPIVTSDYKSPTLSPTNDKLRASPLRLSRELQSTQMGLGVGAIPNEQNQRQTNWIPISWEPSLGGPLGEVLHTTNNSTVECKNDKALNLIESWDNSPRLASSPTGVLQRGAFGSLSNSSAGSSPRAESNKTIDGASLCNGLIVPGLMNPSSLPAL